MPENFLNPEVVVYVYMASCAAVLIFNLLYIASDKSRGRSLERRCKVFKKEICQQLKRIEAGEAVHVAHKKKMSRKLQKLEDLKAYEIAFLEVCEEVQTDIVSTYRKTLYEVFLMLVSFYKRRDEIERAYFARLIETLKVKHYQPETDALTAFLLNSVTERNVYIRENAFKALYAIGDESLIQQAWKNQMQTNIFHNKKLLTDGLLTFAGDKDALAEVLWAECDTFPEELVLPVMQFIRFSSGCFAERFFIVMTNPAKSMEIRLEAIRYFRSHFYGPAKDALKEFIETMNTDEWAYAAVAALSLVNYPEPDVVDALKEGLHSVNWYVRLNCAETLILGLKIPKSQMLDVHNGRDRYAREILTYVTERAGKS